MASQRIAAFISEPYTIYLQCACNLLVYIHSCCTGEKFIIVSFFYMCASPGKATQINVTGAKKSNPLGYVLNSICAPSSHPKRGSAVTYTVVSHRFRHLVLRSRHPLFSLIRHWIEKILALLLCQLLISA